VKKYKKLGFIEEIKFILKNLADEHDGCLSYSTLENLYRNKFEKKRSDFNIRMSILKTQNLCNDIDFGGYDEMGFEITSQGYEFLTFIEKRKRG